VERLHHLTPHIQPGISLHHTLFVVGTQRHRPTAAQMHMLWGLELYIVSEPAAEHFKVHKEKFYWRTCMEIARLAITAVLSSG